MSADKRIIEVSGVRMEIDLRTAKTIEHYKVGDNVKVLKKEYGDSFKVYPGVIVGFDEFKSLPTIVIAYLEQSYSSAGIKFAYLNEKAEDIELAPMHQHEVLFEKTSILQLFDRELEKKDLERKEIEHKKSYFLEHFNRHFEKPGAA